MQVLTFDLETNILPIMEYRGQLLFNKYIIGPRHEISNNVVCATSKGSDQHAHTRSLIRAIASHMNILWLSSY